MGVSNSAIGASLVPPFRPSIGNSLCTPYTLGGVVTQLVTTRPDIAAVHSSFVKAKALRLKATALKNTDRRISVTTNRVLLLCVFMMHLMNVLGSGSPGFVIVITCLSAARP